MAVVAGGTISVGTLDVKVVATPGHTPRHLTYIVRDGSAPPAVFTGGSLLHGSVGRTDLNDDEISDASSRAQYRSVRSLASAAIVARPSNRCRRRRVIHWIVTGPPGRSR